MNISPFNRFHEEYKHEILKDNPNIDKRKLLNECLKKWSSMSDFEKIFYNFDDIDNMPCTIADNGSVVFKQPWFYCKTCWPNDKNKGCCIACAKRCHKGHDIRYCGWCECYCDCPLSGQCECYLKGNPIFVGKFKSTKIETKQAALPLINLPKGPGGWIPPNGLSPTSSQFKPIVISEEGSELSNFQVFSNRRSVDDQMFPDSQFLPKCFDPTYVASLSNTDDNNQEKYVQNNEENEKSVKPNNNNQNLNDESKNISQNLKNDNVNQNNEQPKKKPSIKLAFSGKGGLAKSKEAQYEKPKFDFKPTQKEQPKEEKDQQSLESNENKETETQQTNEEETKQDNDQNKEKTYTKEELQEKSLEELEQIREQIKEKLEQAGIDYKKDENKK